MAKRNRITATYRINESECVQVTVDAASAYPDALSECKAVARGLVHDILADVLELTRDPEPAPDGQAG